MNSVSRISFQSYKNITKPSNGTSQKNSATVGFEDKTEANEKLQNYYVQNAGNVLINPQINSKNKIFTAGELAKIKNLEGTIPEKVETIKGMYLEKRGYDKDLVEIEIQDLNSPLYNGNAGSFDSATGKVTLYMDLQKGKSNEELARIIYHELRHFEQHARICKLVGLDNVIAAHDKSIYDLTDEITSSIKELKADLEDMGDDPDFAEIKQEYQKVIIAKEVMLENMPSRLLNRPFWEKAVAQTKANTNFNENLTLNNWLNPEKLQRLEEHDDGKLYENVEYYTNPFEIDAYEFESKVEEELGLPNEDTKALLENNAKLKDTLKKLYVLKTAQN